MRGLRKIAAAFISLLTLSRLQASVPDQAPYRDSVTVASIDTNAHIQMGKPRMDEINKTTISGYVIDSATNCPIANAMVKVSGTGITTETDSAGFFSTAIKRESMEPIKLVVKCNGYMSKYMDADSLLDSMAIALQPTYEWTADTIKAPDFIMGDTVTIIGIGEQIICGGMGWREEPITYALWYSFLEKITMPIKNDGANQMDNASRPSKPLSPSLAERISGWFDERRNKVKPLSGK